MQIILQSGTLQKFQSRLANKTVHDRGKNSQCDKKNEFETNKVGGKDSQLDKKHEQVKIVDIIMLFKGKLVF